MQGFYFVADGVVPLDFEVYLVLVVLLQFLYLFFVAVLLAFQFIGELLMLFEGVLNVGVFDALIRLQGQLVLLLEGLYLLPVDYVQLLFLELQLLLGTQDLELQLLYRLVLLFDLVDALQVQVVCTLSDPLSILGFYQRVSFFFVLVA